MTSTCRRRPRSTAEVFTDYGSETSLNQTATHHLSLYRAPSGALVFGAGTVQWAWGLDNRTNGGAVDPNMQQATVNLLADMGAQPATLCSPASSPRRRRPTRSRRRRRSRRPRPARTSPTARRSRSPAPRPTPAAGSSPGSRSRPTAARRGTRRPGTTNWTYTWSRQHRQLDRRSCPGPPTTAATSRHRRPGVSGERPLPVLVVRIFHTDDTRQRATPAPAWKSASKFTADAVGIRHRRALLQVGGEHRHPHRQLWSATGTLLATATFSGETASGWQQVLFSQPGRGDRRHDLRRVVPHDHGSLLVDGQRLLRRADRQRSGGLQQSAAARAARRRRRAATASSPTGRARSRRSRSTAANYWVDVTFSDASARAHRARCADGRDRGRRQRRPRRSAGPHRRTTAAAITSYTVTPFIGAAAQTPTIVSGHPPATTTTVTGLTNGTRYTFTVSATNSVGTGPASTRVERGDAERGVAGVHALR